MVAGDGVPFSGECDKVICLAMTAVVVWNIDDALPTFVVALGAGLTVTDGTSDKVPTICGLDVV